VDGGRKRIGRKLLVASLGVATVSFVACGKNKPLMSDAAAADSRADGSAPEDGPTDAGQPNDGPTERPATTVDSGSTLDSGIDRQFTGNLIP
jgi:hypothetical protein